MPDQVSVQQAYIQALRYIDQGYDFSTAVKFLMSENYSEEYAELIVQEAIDAISETYSSQF